MKFTVPEGMQAIGNGRHVETTGNNWVWEQKEPMPSPVHRVRGCFRRLQRTQQLFRPLSRTIGVDDETFRGFSEKHPP